MMTSNVTTTTARIPHRRKPPLPGIRFSRHEVFFRGSSAASEATALFAESNCEATRLKS